MDDYRESAGGPGPSGPSRVRSGAASSGYPYNAFLSYSHAWDGRLAPTLQLELERFAKPWYRTRSLRVFRDDASLAANPGLWPSIERALAGSEWLVLVASAEAAQSPWIDREVAWWVEHRSPQRLLIVLTGGELVWDPSSRDVDWSVTTALPPALRGVLREEPRWVDLRWLRAAEQVDRSNPRLRDQIAEVAAAIHGVPKDSLVGEHLRQHRRAMRLVRGGVSVLTLLLAATMVASVVAVVQRNNAQDEARIAKARQLAALSLANLTNHLDLAQRLAAEAYRLHRDPQTRSALFQAVTASPHLLRYLSAGARVTTVRGSASGNVVLAGTADGQVVRWDLARDIRSTMRVSRAPITSVDTDTAGGRVLAADGRTAVLWEATTGRHSRIRAGQSALVAVSPSGRRLAVLDSSADAATPAGRGVGLTLYDGSGRQLIHTSLPSSWSKLGLPDDNTVMLVGGQGIWERRSATDLSTTASSASDLAPAGVGTVGYSTAGRYYGYDVFGQVSAWDLATSAGNSRVDRPDLQAGTNARQPDVAEAFTISAGGARVATANAGTVYVSATGDPDAEPLVLQGNQGVNDDALAFAGDDRLVSATGDALSVWGLTSPGRFGTDFGIRLPYGCSACEPRLSVAPDGRRAAFVTIDQAVRYRLDGPVHPRVLGIPDGSAHTAASGFPGGQTLPVWSADGSRLVLLGLGNSSALVWASGTTGNPIGRWPPAVPGTDPATARVSADGSTVVIVNSHGDVVVRRFSDGAVEHVFRGTGALDAAGFPPPSVAASISYDLSTAALVEEHTVTLVDAGGGARRKLPGGPAKGVLFTADRLLVARPDDTLDVWDATGNHLLRSIPGTGGYQPEFIAPARGDLVARLRSDDRVVLTRLDTGVTLGSFPLPAPHARQTIMAFTPDGTELLVGAIGGRLTRWEMTEAAWLRIVCDSAARSLRPAEWRQYVGDPVPGTRACGQ